jgi:hypothetical protein
MHAPASFLETPLICLDQSLPLPLRHLLDFPTMLIATPDSDPLYFTVYSACSLDDGLLVVCIYAEINMVGSG